jgi:hypothetical protein
MIYYYYCTVGGSTVGANGSWLGQVADVYCTISILNDISMNGTAQIQFTHCMEFYLTFRD